MVKIMSEYCAMLRREAVPPRCFGISRVESPSDDELSTHTKSEIGGVVTVTELSDDDLDGQREGLLIEHKGQLSRRWQIVAAGTGLFSDGYLNNSIGFVTDFLSHLYSEDSFDKNVAMSNIGALGYAGTIVDMLVFGTFADYIGRRTGLMVCTVMLIVLSILAAGSWGIGMPNNPDGMFACLSVWRTFLGVGIGGEYPCGASASAEATSRFKSGSRHRWLIWSTNCAIDIGFFASSIVALVLVYICGVPGTEGTHGIQTAWRLQLGLGAIPPCVLLILRMKLKESREFRTHKMPNWKKQPYGVLAKNWGFPVLNISFIWLIYDMLSYSWGLITPFLLTSLATTDDKSDMRKGLAWTILFNFFYLPGTIIGGLTADWFGPRVTLFSCLLLQAVVGFCTAAYFGTLKSSVGAFVVVYGIFTALGEASPGNNTMIFATKIVPTQARGRLYGISAAMGKVGALVGTYMFPAIALQYGGTSSVKGISVLFYISSALCIFSAFLTLCLPEVTQEASAVQDLKFRRLMVENGYIEEMDTAPVDLSIHAEH